eukprot:scaffold40045_cov23-Cyclotella_meneghiniana.AAC.3
MEVAVAFAPPRQQHIQNRNMCITLLVSTARCATETDRPNVLPRRCECDGYCILMEMGLLDSVKKSTVDGHDVHKVRDVADAAIEA